MSEMARATRFRWTEQSRRYAQLLAALGHRQCEIAKRLNCHRSTVSRHFRMTAAQPSPSLSELVRLFERYDVERNIEEAIASAGGSTEQARLRASLRRHLPESKSVHTNEAQASEEALSDAQLCAEVDRLVGRPIQIEQEP